MLELTNVAVNTFDLNYLHITWEIEDTDEDLAKYRFSIYRSESPEGPWELIIANLSNTFEYFDRTVNQYSKLRVFNYKVEVLNILDNEYDESEAVSPEDPRGIDFIGMEIRRRNEQLLLPRFIGTRVAFFIEKTFGQRCHECWDDLKQRQRTSQCMTCFNTGYVDGFHTQINGWINKTPGDDESQMEEVGETHPDAVVMWAGHYPGLKPRDLVVDQQNKRWRVAKMLTPTEKRGMVIHQVMAMVQIGKGDIEYRLPVSNIEIPEDTFIGFYPPHGSGLL